jgi:hypothetical protein
MTQPDDSSSRREYQKPKLEEFGTITELTAAASAVGTKSDQGTTGKDKSVI